MSFYCMGKDRKDLKLPRWVTISRSILETTIITCDADLALLALLYPLRITIPISTFSQTSLRMQHRLSAYMSV